ncbi:hypothetical protein [Phyllobacterium phragmitis]|nr:hypothetical protein [Phyllobacterium phragmitis]
MPDRTVTSSVSTQVGYPSVSLTQKKPAQRGNIVKKSSPKLASPKLASNGHLGRAPYICTPSGFGKTSRCFLRG